jgi:hypothetical protein
MTERADGDHGHHDHDERPAETVAAVLHAQGIDPSESELAVATDAYRYFRAQVDRLYDVPVGDDPPADVP